MHGPEALFANDVNLLSARLGAQVLAANDEFFAPKENLLSEAAPVFIPDKYTSCGKWMDGWETRRRRSPGFDWCLLQLGQPTRIRAVDIDTAFFLGNQPPYASITTLADKDSKTEDTLLPQSPLKPGAHNIFSINATTPIRFLKLNIFPDGGVARLRIYGDVVAAKPDSSQAIDLVALTNGARAVACSDAFFSPMNNLLLPGESLHMGDGWETRRRRGPGNDWVIIKLGTPGVPERIEIFTTHYKGNAPGECSFDSCMEPRGETYALATSDQVWQPLVARSPMTPHSAHTLRPQHKAPCSHIRLNIFPDGGVARLRVWGQAV